MAMTAEHKAALAEGRRQAPGAERRLGSKQTIRSMEVKAPNSETPERK